MTQQTFKTVDKPHLIHAFTVLTASDMEAYAAGWVPYLEGSNKTSKSTGFLNVLWKRESRDEDIISMLNHVFIEHAYARTNMEHDSYEKLSRLVLGPRGITLGDDGFEPPSNHEAANHPGAAITSRSDVSQAQRRTWGTHLTSADASSDTRDRKLVFVVHGRDTRPVHHIEQFLHFLGLRMMSWTDARKATGQAQPHTYDIVRAGMDTAGAVVVLFSPDDQGRVKPEFADGPDDPEINPQDQARQNVVLEAGMAFALGRDRTIFVSSGRTRDISDISGFNWVKMDGSFASRQDFIQRLVDAGLTPVPSEADLRHRLAGPFEVK